MRIRAWLIRSADTTAPIVVSDACSAIGPSAFCSATTISPIFPSRGSWVLPVATGGDADALALGAPEPLGDGLDAALGLADGDGLGDGEADGPADPDAAALAVGA